MAEVIRFFSRQAVVSNSGVGANAAAIYSEIFDLSQYSKLEVELLMFSNNDVASSNQVSVQIEETSDPAFSPDTWTAKGNAMSTSGAPPKRGFQNLSAFQRFVRAKMTIASGMNAIVSVEGVAREQV